MAHGGTNKALIGTAIALSPQYYHSLQQCNCGISCLEFPIVNNNQGKLKYLNVTRHLDKQLPKLKAGKTGWRWLLMSNKMSTGNLESSCLSQLLKEDLIYLLLTDGEQESQTLATQVTNDNIIMFHLSISNNIFLDSWHKTIIKRQQINNNSENFELFTGLIIASDELIAQILHETIDADSSVNFPNNLAVLHYPQLERRSILQGLLPLKLDLNQDCNPVKLSSGERAIAKALLILKRLGVYLIVQTVRSLN